MAAVSVSMGKFIAGILIAIVAASVISVGVSMLVPGPQGPEGPQGEQGQLAQQELQGQLAQQELQGQQDHRAKEASECRNKATFRFRFLHSCRHPLIAAFHIHIVAECVTPIPLT